MRSLDTLFDYYGMSEAANDIWKPVLVEKYHYQPREQIVELQDGQVFDFGHTRMRVLHTLGTLVVTAVSFFRMKVFCS